VEGRQHLILDADDTLWENNIFFEEAFQRFCDYLAHSRLSPAEIRQALDAIEIENNKIHGYGTLNFARNLCQCFGELVERTWTEEHLREVTAIAHAIFDSPMCLMEGVKETLPVLAEKHELTLFTKGQIEEQTEKIERSGLKPFFSHYAIVKEKNRDAYLRLAADRQFQLENTWMIGNSPKSDINPALSAGLRAVYVPHAQTWTLEREEILDVPGRLLTVTKFADLKEIFG
jgi:putative hydrolase of the HAD superfamily